MLRVAPRLSVFAVVFLFGVGTSRPAASQDGPFRRGDSNADSEINIADPVFTLQFLFVRGAVPPCRDAADADDDGRLSVSDPVFALSALVGGGPQLPPPGPDCGLDPTADELDCAEYASCERPAGRGVIISEFMAVNATTLLDGDRLDSDWIEILNEGDTAVDLDGYYLTDDPEDRTRWAFHPGEDGVVLAPGESLVVFASGKDDPTYVDRRGNLHTTFLLDGGGEYLALVLPDGETVVSSYGPEIPDQLADVSYGLLRDTVVPRALVAAGQDARLLVAREAVDPGWTAADFDDSAWEIAEIGVGYDDDRRGLFDGEFETNLKSEMQGTTASIYLRVPFTVGDPASIESLTLWMRYDDGFVAYLGGERVAAANAPESPAHDSTATASRPDLEAVGPFVEVDLTAHVGRLAPGANVLAIQGLNDSPGSDRFILLPVLEARVRGDAEVYFAAPTPGEPNGEGAVGFVADTKFSADRGFHEEAFDVVVTTKTPGATIRFTTDGSTPLHSSAEPDASHGEIYAAPIRVESTTLLRAAAFRAGYLPTDVDTQTYLFLRGAGGVLEQPNDLPDYPRVWAGFPADYEMDPEIVQHEVYSQEIEEDLKAIPTLSIVTDHESLWGRQGLYLNPQGRGIAWERPASVELFTADGAESLHVNAGLRVHGGAGRQPEHPKHAFRLLFRRLYGPGKLRYPLYAGDRYGGGAAPEFDKLIVRAGFNNTFPHWYNEQALRAQYVREQWTRDLQFEMGHLSTRGRYVHCYLNGLYWGLFNLGERPDEDFGASYFGGTEDDYDVLKNGTVTAGTATAWNRAQSLARTAQNPEQYEELKELVDFENLIDYVLENMYFGNLDWDNNNSVWMRRNNPPGPFRFLIWDAEFAICLAPGAQPNRWDTILTTDRTRLSNSGRPSGLFQALRRNPEFALLVADRIHRHFFGDGVFTPERVTELWMLRADEVHAPIVGETARWGDHRRDVSSRRDPRTDFPLFTRDGPVREHQKWILETYFPARTEIVIEQLQRAGLYPTLDPPAFSSHGGPIAPGFRLEVTGRRGVTYYTVDGSDPRLEGGDLSPTAVAAGDASFTTILESGAPLRVLVPASGDLGLEWIQPDFDDAGWKEGTSGVGFDSRDDYLELIGADVGAEMDDINASVYFRMPFVLEGLADFDFLTLRMKYDDGFLAYLNGELVASRNAPDDPAWDSTATSSHPDSQALVFEDIDITRHRDLLRVGRNVLAIHGLNRRATDSDLLMLPELAMNTAAKTTLTIGETTLVKARILGEGEWSPLTEALFTVDSGLRITEIMYHPLAPRESEVAAGHDDQDDFEFLEIANAGGAAIDLSGYRLTAGVRFEFDGVALAPGDRVVVVSDLEAFRLRYARDADGIRVVGEYDGKLSNSGEEIALSGPRGVDELRFGYDDAWYRETDGDGHSLVLVSPQRDDDPGDPASWRPSREVLGSPGKSE